MEIYACVRGGLGVNSLLMAQLTTAETATRLGVSDARIRQLIGAGKLAATKKGRDHFIEEKDLAKFIDSRKKSVPKK